MAVNVHTPTCNSCGTKFPGQDSCKSCGCDPNADPSVRVQVLREVEKAPEQAPEKCKINGRVRALTRSRAAGSQRRRRKHGVPR